MSLFCCLTSASRGKYIAISGLPPPKPVASVPNVKVNLDVILKKLKSIVEEYLHLHDIKVSLWLIDLHNLVLLLIKPLSCPAILFFVVFLVLQC